ncbi:hypothetical protein DICA4_E30152 [Diutina catenulata]
MKLQFLLLAPAALAGDAFRLYVTKTGEVKIPVYQGYFDQTLKNAPDVKCPDKENGKIEWNDGWEEKAVFGRFQHPNGAFLNLWPKGHDSWEMFWENGDGERVGHCYRYPAEIKYCGEQPYASCIYYGQREDEQAKRDVENGEQGEIVEMLES